MRWNNWFVWTGVISVVTVRERDRELLYQPATKQAWSGNVPSGFHHPGPEATTTTTTTTTSTTIVLEKKESLLTALFLSLWVKYGLVIK